MEGYLGTILPWAPTFAPRNWAFCNGQMLAINQYTALFSLLGTTYGGNGQTTFALPNLQSRVMVGQGQGPGLQSYVLGQAGGVDLFSLTAAQMPLHVHNNTVAGQASTVTTSVAIPSVIGSNANARRPTTANVPGTVTNDNPPIYSTATPDSTLEPFNATGTVTPQVSITNAPAGGSTPVDNRQPYLAVNFIICLNGLFPSRN